MLNTICLLASSHASSVSSAFHFKARVSTADQAGANLASERGVLSKRPEWAGLQLPCHVHIIALSFTKSLRDLETDIAGMVNFSQCLSFGTNMFSFQQALLTIASAWPFNVIVGTPSPDIIAHRDATLALFCQTGRNLEIRRYMLKHLPTGDWSKRRCLEVYVEPGVDFDKAEVFKRLMDALVLTLAGTFFRLYPRHRWLGADSTVEQVALCDAVHGLGSAAFHYMVTGEMLQAPVSRGDFSAAIEGEAGPASDNISADPAAAMATQPRMVSADPKDGLC